MTAPLRPMHLGEILDRTFQIYRSRFWVFAGIAAIPSVVLVGLEFANLGWWKLSAPTMIPILGINFGYFLFAIGEYHVRLFFRAMGWGCIACAANRILDGDRISVYAAYSFCLRRWRNWLGITSLVWLISLVIPETLGAALFLGITFLASVIAKNDAPTMEALLPPLTGFFIIAGFVFAWWLGGVYLLSIPAWCTEQIGLRRAVQRARNLSKDCRSKVIFTRMLPALLGLILYSAVSLTIRYLMIAMSSGSDAALFAHRYLLASSYTVITSTIATFLAPIFPIAITLIYYDQRIRKEGFDIERMMEAAGLSAVAAPVAAFAGDSMPTVVESAKNEVEPG